MYRLGMLNLQYSVSTAVGLFKSVISFILIASSFTLAKKFANYRICLLYTSDAADDLLCVDLGGRRIIKKKKIKKNKKKTKQQKKTKREEQRTRMIHRKEQYREQSKT